MRRTVGLAIALPFLLPALLIAQNPPTASAGAQGGPQRGFGGPPSPANQPLARDDARHKGFLEIAKRGDIGLLFVGDSITDWFSNPRGTNPATGLEVWNANF